MQDASGARDQPVDRGVDTIRRSLDVTSAAQHALVIADLHEAAGRDLGPMQPERDLQITIVGTGRGEGEVIENALAEALHVRKPVGCGKIDAVLPGCGSGCGAFAPGGNQSHDRSCREVAAN